RALRVAKLLGGRGRSRRGLEPRGDRQATLRLPAGAACPGTHRPAAFPGRGSVRRLPGPPGRAGPQTGVRTAHPARARPRDCRGPRLEALPAVLRKAALAVPSTGPIAAQRRGGARLLLRT